MSEQLQTSPDQPRKQLERHEKLKNSIRNTLTKVLFENIDQTIKNKYNLVLVDGVIQSAHSLDFMIIPKIDRGKMSFVVLKKQNIFNMEIMTRKEVPASATPQNTANEIEEIANKNQIDLDEIRRHFMS